MVKLHYCVCMLNMFWLISCCKENWKLIKTGKSRLHRAASPCLWTSVLFAAMCKPLPQSKFHLPTTASLVQHVHSTLHSQGSGGPWAPQGCVAAPGTPRYLTSCSVFALPATMSPSTASRPWMRTAPWGLGGTHGGSRYSCEWPPLRKPVILPADTMVKPGFVGFCELTVYVVCEVWIIVSAKGICLPGVLFVLSLQFATYFLVILSSLAVEVLYFSFTYKLFLLSHVN